jgi:hypothetical protein
MAFSCKGSATALRRAALHPQRLRGLFGKPADDDLPVRE